MRVALPHVVLELLPIENTSELLHSSIVLIVAALISVELELELSESLRSTLVVALSGPRATCLQGVTQLSGPLSDIPGAEVPLRVVGFYLTIRVVIRVNSEALRLAPQVTSGIGHDGGAQGADQQQREYLHT